MEHQRYSQHRETQEQSGGLMRRVARIRRCLGEIFYGRSKQPVMIGYNDDETPEQLAAYCTEVQEWMQRRRNELSLE